MTFRLRFFEVRLIINSSSAEQLAIIHKMITDIVTPNVKNKIGKQANATPVTLFALVCKNDKARYFAKPTPKDKKRVKAIIPIQYSIQCSHANNGVKITNRISTKIKSAMLSSNAPNWLAVFVFLATYPSSKSLKQHKAYITKNKTDNGVVSNKMNAPAILPVVISEAAYFISITPSLNLVIV